MQNKPEANLLIVNAAQVITCKGPAPKIGKDMQDIGLIEHGAVACRYNRIVWIGESDQTQNIPIELTLDAQIIYADNRVVMPGFVDPHTHLVFGGSREEEFAKKLQGVPYLEILEQGGGILNTVQKTRDTSELDLYKRGIYWLNKMLSHGTTTVEIKSGYGLAREHELRILRVIKLLAEGHHIEVVPTFLGAHAWPKDKSRKEYLEELLCIIEELRDQKFLAEFCDVFCEENAFSPKESAFLLKWAAYNGIRPKIHAGEFNDLGGAKIAAELGAASLDHGEHISDEDLVLLRDRKIPIVLMPGVNFHLGTPPANARKMIATGVPVALATDFNPGSSPVLSMQFIIQLACRMYQMTMEEAINAATINAAYALDRAGRLGSIEVGKEADFIILDVPTYKQLPYWIGQNLVKMVIKSGKIVQQNNPEKGTILTT